jgi:two-component system sensor histidine kinase KdpD
MHVAGLVLAALLILAAAVAGLLMAPRWGTSSVALLFLPPVLVTARYFGLKSALVAAFAAALAFNYFFTEP